MNEMKSFRGQLRHGDQVRLDQIEGELSSPESATGDNPWYGWFTLPEGETLNIGDRFDLRLDDGRACSITLTQIRPSKDGESSAEFRGLSPLK